VQYQQKKKKKKKKKKKTSEVCETAKYVSGGKLLFGNETIR
jgi:hypothetical protein